MTDRRLTVDELRAWLDRAPQRRSVKFLGPWPRWHAWFTAADGEYLGQRSARTGPDLTDAKQPCACDVCSKGRQNAKVAPQSTNGEDDSI